MRYAALDTSGYFAPTPEKSLMEISFTVSVCSVRVVYHTGVLTIAFEDAGGAKNCCACEEVKNCYEQRFLLKGFQKESNGR